MLNVRGNKALLLIPTARLEEFSAVTESWKNLNEKWQLQEAKTSPQLVEAQPALTTPYTHYNSPEVVEEPPLAERTADMRDAPALPFQLAGRGRGALHHSITIGYTLRVSIKLICLKRE